MESRYAHRFKLNWDRDATKVNTVDHPPLLAVNSDRDIAVQFPTGPLAATATTTQLPFARPVNKSRFDGTVAFTKAVLPVRAGIKYVRLD